MTELERVRIAAGRVEATSQEVAMTAPGNGGSGERRSLIGVLRDYPLITATIVVCTLIGVVLGLVFLPEEWTVLRKVAGGALGGAGCGLIVTAPRIVG